MRRCPLLLAAALALGCRDRTPSSQSPAATAKGPCRGPAEALARVRKPAWYDPRSTTGPWPPRRGSEEGGCRLEERELVAGMRPAVELSCASGHGEQGTALYRVQADGCFVEVGSWVGQRWAAIANRHGDWPDVEVEAAPAHSDGKRLSTVWSYEFDGTRYKRVRTEQHVEADGEH